MPAMIPHIENKARHSRSTAYIHHRMANIEFFSKVLRSSAAHSSHHFPRAAAIFRNPVEIQMTHYRFPPLHDSGARRRVKYSAMDKQRANGKGFDLIEPFRFAGWTINLAEKPLDWMVRSI